MRTMIVDDEDVDRQVLREALEAIDCVQLVGEAEDGEAALAKIATLHPDLVFLDIETPVMDGFAVLNRLKRGRMPMVIMVTTQDGHARRAIAAGAVDCLLKPVDQLEICKAVERARVILQNPTRMLENMARLQRFAAPPEGYLAWPGKIVGKFGREYFLLTPNEVQAVQADGDVTWILTAERRYMAIQNLTALEDRLQNTSFRRVHQNALINVEQIRKVTMITSRRCLITLNNGEEFIVSKRHAQNVCALLNQ